MKKEEFNMYEKPTVKVVKFMVEHGFAGSFGGGSEGTGGEDGEEETELVGRKVSIWEKERPAGSGNGGAWDYSF